MSENGIQKKVPTALKGKGQYFVALGVVASMLLVAQVPIFVVFFFGIFAYFMAKMFSTGARNETREIFEFYLSAHEILKADERKWFGFEIKETITRGEKIIHRMKGSPPLVFFTLGALYHKIGDHKAAVNNLAYVIENDRSDEAAYLEPSNELRSYTKILRKIERDPSDAPLTSAAIRGLERARKLRGKILLEESRVQFANPARPELTSQQQTNSGQYEFSSGIDNGPSDRVSITQDLSHIDRRNEEGLNAEMARQSFNTGKSSAGPLSDPFADRKPITEVLHDIYDKNVQ